MNAVTSILEAASARRTAQQHAPVINDHPDRAVRVEQHHGSALWRMDRVREFTGLCQSTIYSLMKQGKFPQAFPLVGRTVAWRAGDVVAWCEAKAAQGGATA